MFLQSEELEFFESNFKNYASCSFVHKSEVSESVDINYPMKAFNSFGSNPEHIDT